MRASMNVAVVGATGAVGEAMNGAANDRRLPRANRSLSSSASTPRMPAEPQLGASFSRVAGSRGVAEVATLIMGR